MTENKRKRFKMSNLNDVGISDHEKRRLYDLRTVEGVISVYECLNELHEENTDLKQILKQQMKDPTNEINKLNDVINRLHWENHQLTTQMETIKNTIEEAYQTERTELGRSVLKQLLEKIQ